MYIYIYTYIRIHTPHPRTLRPRSKKTGWPEPPANLYYEISDISKLSNINIENNEIRVISNIIRIGPSPSRKGASPACPIINDHTHDNDT